MASKAAPKSTLNAHSKQDALQAAFAHIDKQYGKGSIMRLGEGIQQKCEVIPTGSIAINCALGVGGLPRGRIVEIYGPEASGKTTFTLHVIAEAQKAGGVCAFIDAEHAMDSTYSKNIGVNVDNLIISQPDYGEQALDIAETLIRSGAVDVVVVDSVAALVPKVEVEGEIGDQHVGLQARLMSQALRKLTSVVHKSKAVLIFINQIRHKIGGMAFMNNETTSGGNALKFYASVRLDVRRIATLKKADGPFGNRVAVKVVKNKVAPPFKRVEVDLIFGKGVSAELDLLDMALSLGIVQQSGSWFTTNGDKLAQGRENCLQKLASDKELFSSLSNAVYTALDKKMEQGGQQSE